MVRGSLLERGGTNHNELADGCERVSHGKIKPTGPSSSEPTSKGGHYTTNVRVDRALVTA